MRRSASRLEQTPASLRYLFSLTGSFFCKNSSLIRLLTCKHSAYTVVCKKTVSAVKEQGVSDPVGIHDILNRPAVISRIDHHDLPVVRRQERDKAVGKGILHHKQTLPACRHGPDIKHRSISSQIDSVLILCLQ